MSPSYKNFGNLVHCFVFATKFFSNLDNAFSNLYKFFSLLFCQWLNSLECLERGAVERKVPSSIPNWATYHDHFILLKAKHLGNLVHCFVKTKIFFSFLFHSERASFWKKNKIIRRFKNFFFVFFFCLVRCRYCRLKKNIDLTVAPSIIIMS